MTRLWLAEGFPVTAEDLRDTARYLAGAVEDVPEEMAEERLFADSRAKALRRLAELMEASGVERARFDSGASLTVEGVSLPFSFADADRERLSFRLGMRPS